MSVDEASSSESGNSDDLVAVAQIVRTRGLRGEVVAELLTDFPDRFDGLERLIAIKPDGTRESIDLEEHWLQAKHIVLKFLGYDSIEAARALIGSELTVPEAERVELSDDEYYDWELAGCRVDTTSGTHIGQVRTVMHTGATDLLVVMGVNTEREHLIPLADEICVEIDIVGKLIRINPPDGLLEL
jgi:16S rRNA processing protein RimM